MNTKTTTALTALMLLVGGAAAQIQTQRPTTSIEATLINTDPAPVQSGEDAEITFKVRNTGNTEAENIKLQLIDSFPFKIKPDRKTNYSLGDMMPGQEYQISTEVLVSEQAPDGLNSLKFKTFHGETTITHEVPVQVQSQDIELNLANLKTSPTTLTPDTEDAKLTLQVVNNGEKTAENTVINIELPETFQATSSFSTRQALGNIAPGQVKTAEFTFDVGKNARKGSVHIPATISYSADSDDTTSRIKEEAGFSFHLAGKPQFKVVEVESNLETGAKGELRVKVKNTGSEKSSSTRIRVLDSSDLPFSYDSSSQYIGTLEPNQTGTAVFNVETETDAVAKDYLIDFELRGVKDTQVYVEDET
ncbi:MAG: COG1361 S-layer family protein, partial [Candidatus Nanohaloarchaea archaeon]